MEFSYNGVRDKTDGHSYFPHLWTLFLIML
jgi:hypothetical protein